MSTICDIAIKISDPNKVVAEIEEYYIVGEKINKDFSNEFEFQFSSNEEDEFIVREDYKGSRTFVIHQEHNPEWTQIEYSIINVYEFDELLRRLTAKFRTTAFIGFNQTTNDDFRFAFFENGFLKRSIYIKYIEAHNHRRIIDNFGKKLSFETFSLGTPFTIEILKDQYLNYEVFNTWYKELGFNYKKREHLKFLHLEIQNFKC